MIFGVPLTLERPWVLLLLLVLAIATVRIARRSLAGQPPELARVTLGLRLFVLTLLCLALGGLAWVQEGEGVTVVVLRDHSVSVPSVEADRIVARIARQEPTGEDDRIGLISFGRDAREEVLPDRVLRPATAIRVDREGTDIAESFRLADSMFTGSHATGRRRVVLITDGNATEGDTLRAARNLASTGAVIDVIPVEYSYDREILVEDLRVPSEVHPEEPFLVEAVIDSDLPGEGTVQLYEDERLVEERIVDFAAGKNRVEFSRVRSEQGSSTYRVQLTPAAGRDTLPGNNIGHGFTRVVGPPRVLFITADPAAQRPLLDALAASRIDCEVVGPEGVPSGPRGLLPYSSIVIADVPAFALGSDSIEAIHGVVRSLGVGLLMIGSPDTFGAGGYRGTAIERALPVELDIRQRKEIPNGALAIILHTCEFEAGNMWAKAITTAAIEALTPKDLVGVLLYDAFGRDRWGIPLQRVGDPQSLIAQVRALQPADMLSFAPTMALGLQGLIDAPAVSKHMVIISDGDPTQPAAETLQGFQEAGISVSTVCIQPHGGRDTGVLKLLALETGGRYYRADDPRQLPQIFFREAIEIRRNLIREVSFTPALRTPVEAVRGFSGFPPLHGTVLTTEKPLAEVALVSDEEDPVLAQWRYGLGVVAAFTSDATGRWGRDWVEWEGFETFWAQLIRSVSRKERSDILESSHVLDGERGTLQVDAIDIEGRFIDGLAIEARILDPELREQDLELQQVGPGRYEGSFRAEASGGYLVIYSFEGPGGIRGSSTSGLSVAYPREYRYLRSDLAELERIAQASGGRIVSPDEDVFRREGLQVRRDPQPAWSPLVRWALLILVVDIFLRRVAVNWTTLLRPVGRRRGAAEPVPAAGVLSSGEAPDRHLETAAEPPPPVIGKGRAAGVEEKREEPQDSPSVTSQLLQAKKRARDRSDDR
jgi:uncharacterized membrane protein